MNHVTLIGRLGKDPETKQFGGKSVCKFSLATQETKDKVSWHTITTFEKTAEIAQKYLVKGSQVAVEGRISYSESEKDGVKRYYTEIVATRIELIGSKQDREDRPQSNTSRSNYAGANDDYVPPPAGIDDDIPF